eukprot:1317229-Lingulodinium_polyedra.AAC.1
MRTRCVDALERWSRTLQTLLGTTQNCFICIDELQKRPVIGPKNALTRPINALPKPWRLWRRPGKNLATPWQRYGGRTGDALGNALGHVRNALDTPQTPCARPPPSPPQMPREPNARKTVGMPPR